MLAHSEPLLTSHLPTSHWPNQVTLASPKLSGSHRKEADTRLLQPEEPGSVTHSKRNCSNTRG